MTTASKPVLLKFLDASTRHITEEDSRRLHSWTVGVVVEYQHGWWITLPPVEEADATYQACRECGLSWSFVQLVRLAFDAGVGWIHLDADGTLYDFLPAHCW